MISPKLSLKRLLYLSVFLPFLFGSCEYDNDDNNFHHLEEPGQIYVGIDLAGADASQTIYIYQSTNLYYTLNTSGKRVVAQAFYLDNNLLEGIWSTGDDRYSITISPEEFDNSEHTLRLDMALASGTGSFAEAVGAEHYLGSFSFKLVYVKSAFDLNIKQRATDDGYFEMYWEKPQSPYLTVTGYEIYNGATLLETINDPDKTSFVDPEYVYGYKTYKIVIKYAQADVPNNEVYYTTKYEIINEDNITIEHQDMENIRLTWNNPNPFACKYVLTWFNNVVKYIPEGENAAELKRLSFPTYGYGYDLYILPTTADYADYKKYTNRASLSYNDTRLVGGGYNLSLNKATKNMYAINESTKSALVYDATTMKLIREVKLPINFSTGAKIFGSASGLTGIDDSYKIYIYKNNTFGELQHTLATNGNSVWNWTLTDNDKVIYSNYYGIYVVDAATGNTIGEIPTKQTFAVSQDGKYLCAYHQNEYEMYEIKDTGLELKARKTMVLGYGQLTFDPMNSSVLYHAQEEKTQVFNPLDFSVTKELEGEYKGTDVFTGNMVFNDKTYSTTKKINITDKNFNTIFSYNLANTGDASTIMIVNNILLKDGCYLNISKMLQQ